MNSDFKHYTIIALLTLSFFLSACTTTSPKPPTVSDEPAVQKQADNTPLISQIQWMSLQEMLQQALHKVPGAEIKTVETGGLHLIIPVSQGFSSGKKDIQPSLARVLDAIIPTLHEAPLVAIHIVGHTDSIGSEMHNLRLSILRAESVMEYLRSHGIEATRLSADGKGEAHPIADNATEDGRARNRRVEFFLLPPKNS